MGVCGIWQPIHCSNSPFCVGMKTGPMPQDVLIVKAVVPDHKDLATIQTFRLWTNAGKTRHLQFLHVNLLMMRLQTLFAA
eukprot:6944152-Karenia_brevis.AAC.1